MPAARPASQPGVIRGLMFVGGGSHDFDTLPRRLADKLRQEADIDIRVTSDLGEITEATWRPSTWWFSTPVWTRAWMRRKQKALLDALRQGKGLVAMHCALWCFQDWPEWRKILGGLVLKHDKFGPYEVGVVYPMHPIAARRSLEVFHHG